MGEFEKKKMFVFNGDFVDCGVWGVEVLLLLLARKAFASERVILFRGNYEMEFCMECYGFECELSVKYGKIVGWWLYLMFLELCVVLSLVCKVGDVTLILYGGLFWSVLLLKREVVMNLKLGILVELEKVLKGGVDLIGEGCLMIVGDVLWSDFIFEDGLYYNENRGIGI